MLYNKLLRVVQAHLLLVWMITGGIFGRFVAGRKQPPAMLTRSSSAREQLRPLL